jgi:hypothetical protein
VVRQTPRCTAVGHAVMISTSSGARPPGAVRRRLRATRMGRMRRLWVAMLA